MATKENTVTATPKLNLVDPEDGDAGDTSTPARRVETAQPGWLRAPCVADRVPVWEDRLPRRKGRKAPLFWLLGAHGGAGVSTLESVWAPAGDARRGWPAAEAAPFVVVVARLQLDGLGAAQQLLLQHQSGNAGGCTLLGLVTIDAAPGKAPVSVRRRREVVAAAAPQSWHIGWIPELLAVPGGDLAQWSPGYEQPETKRFARPASVTAAVPTTLDTVGDALFAAARDQWTQQ